MYRNAYINVFTPAVNVWYVNMLGPIREMGVVGGMQVCGVNASACGRFLPCDNMNL